MSEIELEFKTLSGFQADQQRLLLGVRHAGSDSVRPRWNPDVDVDVFVQWRQMILPTQGLQFLFFCL